MSLVALAGTARKRGSSTPLVISLVQQVASEHTSGSSSTPTATLGAVTTTAGNHLILRATTNSKVNSVADSKGNTWQVDSSQSGGPWVTFASCLITTPLVAGDTITATLAGATGIHGFIVDEWLNILAAGWFGAAAAIKSNGGNTSRSTNAVTASAGALILGVWGSSVIEAAWSPGAGYTSFTTVTFTTIGNDELEGEYQVDSGSGGSYAPSATGTSGSFYGIAAYYRAATS